ncbi:hypothetical protein PFISCL1PPCAC_6668, partial [Pristionchus fissidentatus]
RMMKRRRVIVEESSDDEETASKVPENRENSIKREEKQRNNGGQQRRHSNIIPVSSDESLSSSPLFSEEETRRNDNRRDGMRRVKKREEEEEEERRQKKVEEVKDEDEIQVVFDSSLNDGSTKNSTLSNPTSPALDKLALDRSVREVRFLKEELDKAKERENEITRHVNEIRDKSKKLTDDLDESVTEISKLKRQLDAAYSATRAAELKAELAETSLEMKPIVMVADPKQQKIKEALEEKIADLTASIERLKKEMEVALRDEREKTREAQADARSTRSHLDQVTEDLKKMEEKIGKAKLKEAELWRQIKDGKEKQSAEVDKLNAEQARLTRLFEGACREAHTAQLRAEAAENQLESKRFAVPEMVKENIELHKKVTELTRNNQRIKVEAQELIAVPAVSFMECKKKLEEMEKENEKSKKILTEWKKMAATVEQRLNNRINSLEAALREVEQNHTTANKKLQEARQNCVRMNGELRGKEEELRQEKKRKETTVNGSPCDSATQLQLAQLRELCKKQHDVIKSHSSSSEKQEKRIEELLNDNVAMKESQLKAEEERDTSKAAHHIILDQKNRLQTEFDNWKKMNGGTASMAVSEQCFNGFGQIPLPPPPPAPDLRGAGAHPAPMNVARNGVHYYTSSAMSMEDTRRQYNSNVNLNLNLGANWNDGGHPHDYRRPSRGRSGYPMRPQTSSIASSGRFNPSPTPPFESQPNPQHWNRY